MDSAHRRLVIGLGGALLAALLVIAFLLGRLSAPPTVPVAVSTPARSTTMPPVGVEIASPAPGETASVESAPDIVASAPDAQRAALPAPSFQSVPAQVPQPALITAANPSTERSQVAAYFAAVDRVGEMGSGDPQAFASSLMQSVSSGDFSGFDDLLAKARSQRDQIRSLTPPKVCLEHHRLALALSNDSVSMMERLKTALMKGDAAALMTMATEGQTLEAQAKQLKALSDGIKRQAGL